MPPAVYASACVPLYHGTITNDNHMPRWFSDSPFRHSIRLACVTIAAAIRIQLTRVIMLSVEYIAGFFDGEGGVNIAGNKVSGERENTRGETRTINHIRWMLRVYVCNNHVDVLRQIQEVVGGTIQKTGGKTPNRKPSYRLILCGKYSQRFLALVRPYVVVKARQVDIGIAFGESLDSSKPEPGHRRQIAAPEIQERRQELYQELIRINSRGTAEPKPGTLSLPVRQPKTVQCKHCDTMVEIRKPSSRRPRFNGVCRPCYIARYIGRHNRSS